MRPIPRSSRMDLNALLRRAVELGASDIHLKVGQPPILRRDGDLDPMEGLPALDEAASRRSCRSSAPRAGEARALRRVRRPRHRVPGRGSAALPRQRLPAARRHLVRLPRHPEDGAELRAAEPARRRPEARRGAPRPRPRHRRDRLGEDDDARGDDRLHEPEPEAAHHHDRGPDRDPASRTTAASSTSARSGSTPSRSARRCAARSGRTRTRF